MTLGKRLLALAEGDQKILPMLSKDVNEHEEWPLLQICLEAAKKGEKEADVGKCVPPCLEKEEIFFKKDHCNHVIAYWS